MKAGSREIPNPSWSRRSFSSWIYLVALALVFGCSSGAVHANLPTAAEKNDPLVLADALEALIEQGKDTPADRSYAYEKLAQIPQKNTAADAFARAAIIGRLVQQKGLLAANLIGSVERYARNSQALDPNFRKGAARRLLGTLYVLAPAAFLNDGDSEDGVEILEELVEEHPEDLENHLRYAEALVSLNDHESAHEPLCRCVGGKSALRRDDQALLTRLIRDVEPLSCR